MHPRPNPPYSSCLWHLNKLPSCYDVMSSCTVLDAVCWVGPKFAKFIFNNNFQIARVGSLSARAVNRTSQNFTMLACFSMLAFSLFTRAVTTLLNWHLNTVSGCEIGNKGEPLPGRGLLRTFATSVWQLYLAACPPSWSKLRKWIETFQKFPPVSNLIQQIKQVSFGQSPTKIKYIKLRNIM